jgi:hypothetical protein
MRKFPKPFESCCEGKFFTEQKGQFPDFGISKLFRKAKNIFVPTQDKIGSCCYQPTSKGLPEIVVPV